MTVMEKLAGIIRDVFDDDTLTITLRTTASDVDGWDSLSHVNLIVAVESSFAIRFSQKEIFCFRNVGDLLTCIEGKIAA